MVTFGLTTFAGTETDRLPSGASSAAWMRPPSLSLSTVCPFVPGTARSRPPLGSTVASRGGRFTEARIFAVSARTRELE